MRTRRQQLRLPDEVRYVQRRAAAHDGRVVVIGQFVLLDRDGRRFGSSIPPIISRCVSLAAAIPSPSAFRQTETTYGVAWPGKYPIEGRAFVYADRRSRRVSTILGYPINP